jgi:hypothetical protein
VFSSAVADWAGTYASWTGTPLAVVQPCQSSRHTPPSQPATPLARPFSAVLTCRIRRAINRGRLDTCAFRRPPLPWRHNWLSTIVDSAVSNSEHLPC